MNLDFLISKYLDADLSAEEDKLLRKILSEDPSAREIFDSSVAINHAMREDALHLQAPADIIRQTEDKILMQILNQSNEVRIYSDYNDPVKFLNMKLRRRVKSVVSAFFATAVWFAAVVNFSDGSFRLTQDAASYLSDNGSSSEQDKFAAPPQPAAERKSAIRKFFAQKPRNTDAPAESRNEATAGGGLIASADPLPQQEDTRDNSFGTSENHIIAQAGTEVLNNEESASIRPAYPLQTIAASQMLPVKSFPELSPGNSFAIGNGKDEVQMTTFVSNDIISSQKKTGSPSSVSQSISYGITADDRIGLELGYSAYTGKDGQSSGSDIGYLLFRQGRSSTGEASVSAEKRGPSILGSNIGNPPVEVPRSDGSKSASTRPITPLRPSAGDLYWGAAFYERRLFNFSPVTVHARLGVGGSSEGGIGFGRVFGRYDVISGVSLTFGTESRTLVIRMPEGMGKSYDVASSLSLIYGLQVRF